MILLSIEQDHKHTNRYKYIALRGFFGMCLSNMYVFPSAIGRGVNALSLHSGDMREMFFLTSAIGLLQYPHLIGSMDNSQGTEWVRLLYIQKKYEKRGQTIPVCK